MEMTDKKNKLFTFRVNNSEYLFSGYTGLLMNLNEKLKEGLRDIEHIKDTKVLGYLFGNQSQPANAQIIPEDERIIQQLTVLVTNKCNLKCRYCYEMANNVINNTNMMLKTFQSGIEFLLSEFKTKGPVHIQFFGGEPLMNTRLIKDAVDYLEGLKNNKGIDFKYLVTTNGTILNEDIITFLVENNFVLMVSIDGFKEIHDYYRPYKNGNGSHDKIIKNIERFSKYLKVVARVTLTNLDTNIVKLYEELASQGVWEMQLEIVADKGINEHDWVEKFKPLKKRIKEMEYYFIEKAKKGQLVRYKNLLKYLKIIHSGIAGSEKRFPCLAGISSFSLAVNGDIYLCHRFNNVEALKLGNVTDRFYSDILINFLQDHHISARKGKCRTCWAGILCGGTCYHTTYAVTGETNPTNKMHCAYTQELIRSALNIYVYLSPAEKIFLSNIK